MSLSVCLSVYLSTYLSARLKTKQFCETSLIFERNNVQNETILRDFFIIWNLTTSKTKQFCETYSIFEFDNIKNKIILRDFLQNGKLSAALTASYQCVLRFFYSTSLKYCACHEKLMPGHTKCCTCHAKSS